MAILRPLKQEDYHNLATIKLCESDAREIEAATGSDPNSEIIRSAYISDWVEVIEEDDGSIIGAIGLCIERGWAIPWYVHTDAVDKYKLLVAIHSKKLIRRMLLAKLPLVNYVDQRNKAAIKWLKWLGFTVEQGSAYLSDPTVPFHLFYMEP